MTSCNIAVAAVYVCGAELNDEIAFNLIQVTKRKLKKNQRKNPTFLPWWWWNRIHNCISSTHSPKFKLIFVNPSEITFPKCISHSLFACHVHHVERFHIQHSWFNSFTFDARRFFFQMFARTFFLSLMLSSSATLFYHMKLTVCRTSDAISNILAKFFFSFCVCF